MCSAKCYAVAFPGNPLQAGSIMIDSYHALQFPNTSAFCRPFLPKEDNTSGKRPGRSAAAKAKAKAKSQALRRNPSRVKQELSSPPNKGGRGRGGKAPKKKTR